MFLYYITDRKQLSSHADERKRLLLERIRMCAELGIDAIQIREKDLSSRELVELGRQAAVVVHDAKPANGCSRPRLLINSRIDVAIACKANGVHLRSNDISAADARAIFQSAGVARPVIGVSCHTLPEIELAEGNGAAFAVFGPVFEKMQADAALAGLDGLQQVCRKRPNSISGMLILALGGVTVANAAQCVEAGASGIAGIRLFQEGNPVQTISRLRTIVTA